MTSERYRKPDWVYFLDENSTKHAKGTVVFGWSSGDYFEPPMEEPILELEQVEPIMDFLNEGFPNGWEIKDGKVVEYKP